MNSFQNYCPGQIIGKFNPYVFFLQCDQFGKRCEYCFKRSEKLLKCSKCHISYYCDKTCQSNIWKFHKNECFILNNNYKLDDTFPLFAFLMMRIITKLANGRYFNSSETVFGIKRSYSDLVAHEREISDDVQKTADFDNINYFLCMFYKDRKILNSINLFEIFCKMLINTFSICDDELNNIGVGFYLGGSVFNHSCDPNAVATFNGTEMIIRSLTNIAKGNEILISYIDQMQPTHKRRDILLKQYYFFCQCNRCNNVQLNYEMTTNQCFLKKECFFHIKNDGSISGECRNHKKCSEIVKVFEEVNLFNREMKLLVKNSAIVTNNIPSLTSMYKQISEKYSNFMNDNSFLSYSLNDIALEICIQLQDMETAIHHARRMQIILSKYFSGPNPRLANHLAKLGKIELYLADENASISLQKAYEMLLITNGIDSSLTIQVADLILQCQLEQTHLKS